MKPGEWKLYEQLHRSHYPNPGVTTMGRGIWIELGDELPAPGERVRVVSGEYTGHIDTVECIVIDRRVGMRYHLTDGVEYRPDAVTRHIPPATVTIPAEATDSMVKAFSKFIGADLPNTYRAAISAAIRAGAEEVGE